MKIKLHEISIFFFAIYALILLKTLYFFNYFEQTDAFFYGLTCTSILYNIQFVKKIIFLLKKRKKIVKFDFIK